MTIKNLEIEIRNHDFGPIEKGPFMEAQIKGTKKIGIGDGLFHSFYPNHQGRGGTQFGYEDSIKPVINIIYKDNVVEEIELKDVFLPLPGESCTFKVPLRENKNYDDIQFLNLSLKTYKFGHSRSGGGGMSCTGTAELGAIAIQSSKISQWDKTYFSVSLSEQWTRDSTINSNSEEYIPSNPSDFMEIRQITKLKEVRDNSWKNVKLVPCPEWRSTLANDWIKNEQISQNYNLHNGDLFIIPIHCFLEGQLGYVIGINDYNHQTKPTKEHVEAFRQYAKNNEGYKQEYDSYQIWFYSSTRDSTAQGTETNYCYQQST